MQIFHIRSRLRILLKTTQIAKSNIFFINPQFSYHLSLFFLHVSEISIIFHAKMLLMKINKSVFDSKNHYLMISKVIQKCADSLNYVCVCTVT